MSSNERRGDDDLSMSSSLDEGKTGIGNCAHRAALDAGRASAKEEVAAPGMRTAHGTSGRAVGSRLGQLNDTRVEIVEAILQTVKEVVKLTYMR